MSGTERVRPDLSRDEAEALLSYTQMCLHADDSFDEFRENLESAVEELKRSLQTDTARSESGTRTEGSE